MATTESSRTTWYWMESGLIQDSPRGPIDGAELVRLMKAGKVGPQTLVSSNGTGGWARVDELPGVLRAYRQVEARQQAAKEQARREAVAARERAKTQALEERRLKLAEREVARRQERQQPIAAQPVYAAQPAEQAQPAAAIQQTVNVVVQQRREERSVLLALLLVFLFGPLGLMYASPAGGVLLMCLTVLIGVFTLGAGLIIWIPLLWVICPIWAMAACWNEAA